MASRELGESRTGRQQGTLYVSILAREERQGGLTPWKRFKGKEKGPRNCRKETWGSGDECTFSFPFTRDHSPPSKSL